MTTELLLIYIVLVVLLGALVALLVLVQRSLSDLGTMLRELQRDLTPVAYELRKISENMASATESLKTGLEKTNRMTDALGNIGDDLETGRRVIKGGVSVLSEIAKPWLAKLGVMRPD